MKTVKFFSFIICFMLGLRFVPLANAQEFFFQDEFNESRPTNTPDSDKWTFFSNSASGINSILQENGFLWLSQANNTPQFPLVISKNGLPAGDFSTEIQFQYTEVTPWGNGIALSENSPVNGENDFTKLLLTIDVWQDQSVPNMRISFEGSDVYTLSVNTNPHNLKVNRIGQKYQVYLDNILIYTSPNTSKQVKYIWMGNPVSIPSLIPNWTKFKVDYVRVKALAPEPFLEDLPWDYQSKGFTFNEAALNINSYFDHEYPLIRFLNNSKQCPPAPIENPTRTLKFTGENLPEPDAFYSCHDGYDYGKKAGANIGDPILAAADGIATRGNPISCGACGNYIVINHGNGYQTRYYHMLDGSPFLQLGQSAHVSAGQQIGKVGFSGNVQPKGEGGAHIHFMVVQDRNGDGNFEDDLLAGGVTDPFGWQSADPDPWSLFEFKDPNTNSTLWKGNSSFYLWKKKLDNLNTSLTANGGLFNVGRYSVDMPQNITNEDLNLEIQSTPSTNIIGNIVSLGSSVRMSARDSFGNLITTYPTFFNILVDFQIIKLDGFKTSTLSFYSSPDGITWTKEPTEIDLENKTARTSVNHMTYFALAAERLDTIAPSTQATLNGQQGQNMWFRSNVQLNLNAADNPGGLGVDYILYKVDNQDWQIFTNPLTFSEEGHHKVEFYSIDKDENVEDIKSTEFDIDKTPPEAKIFIDQDIQDLVVSGLDQNQTTLQTLPNTKTKKKDDAIYIISDLAGNTLTLDVRDRDKDKKDRFGVFNIQYNQDPQITLPSNHLNVNYKGSKSKLNVEEQNFEIKGDVKIRIKYDLKKNKSTIVTKESNEEKVKETLNGLILLQLATDKGTLNFKY